MSLKVNAWGSGGKLSGSQAGLQGGPGSTDRVLRWQGDGKGQVFRVFGGNHVKKQRTSRLQLLLALLGASPVPGSARSKGHC